METEWHENFVQNIAADLLHHKGLTVDKYCENIVKPQWPLDEIALVLFARLYKFHICVFLEGKYWTTNRDDSLKVPKIFLIYCGNLKFYDTVREGSLQEGIFNKSPAVQYYLRSKGMEDNVPVSTSTKSETVPRKTLNSLQASLSTKSDLDKAYKEYQKLNKEHFKPP